MKTGTLLIQGVLLLLVGSLPALADADRFEKLQAVYSHLGIPDEPSLYNELKVWDGAETKQAFETIYRYADPAHLLSSYIRWDDNKLSVYRDRDTKKVLDFELSFKKAGYPEDRKNLLSALRRAAVFNSLNAPLQGLRIALDPGHMGGRDWDRRTGKYVSVPGGYVSEGTIAFQTCMLLMRELKLLGADVRITRRALGPVTELPLETYELKPFAINEFRSSSDAPWFDALLNSAPLGARLFAAFDHSAKVRSLFSEAQRETYFISRADLAERARQINAFHPHLTLVVHFDAAELHKLQNTHSEVRTYVPGDLLPGEIATREARAMTIRNLVDGHRWMESNVFSAAVVKGISDVTGIKLKTSDQDYQAIKVSDGVYARNLALNRLVSESVMTYVEVLSYDYASEFWKLNKLNRHTEVEGVRLDYPSRLDDIVDGMKRGILDYVHSLEKQSLAQLQ